MHLLRALHLGPEHKDEPLAAAPCARAVGGEAAGVKFRVHAELLDPLLDLHGDEHVLAPRRVPDEALDALELERAVVLLDREPVDPQSTTLLRSRLRSSISRSMPRTVVRYLRLALSPSW
jgi:hypothetical protein